MQSYIDYLLSDIAAACRVEELPPSSGKQSIEDHFAEIEAWLECEPEFTFGYYCGLSKDQFPPSEQLTKSQLKEICKAFRNLLFSWNLSADIPKTLSIAKTYPLLISILEKKVQIVNTGFIGIEFCTYDPATCPFEALCGCRKIQSEMANR